MKEGKNNTVMLTIIGIATLLVAVVGATFAFFSAQISGDVSKTPVTVTSANLVIGFTGGSVITANDIYPSSTEWATKSFTISSSSTSGTSSTYSVKMVVEENDSCANTDEYCVVASGETTGTIKKFQSGALSYTVESASSTYDSQKKQNAAGDAPFTATETTITDLDKGDEITLGNGTIIGLGTGSEVTHTYTLKMYFKDNSSDQNANQGAQFKAHLEAVDGKIS